MDGIPGFIFAVFEWSMICKNDPVSAVINQDGYVPREVDPDLGSKCTNKVICK